MWKRLQNSLYYILFTQEENLKIYISDYVKLWTVQFSVDEFISCLKESNRILKIETNELVTNGIDMLSHPETLKNTDVSQVGQNLKLSLSKSFGYPFKVIMTLRLGSHELFFNKVTQPLLKTIQDLRSSELELRHLLQNKDKEIQEYKMEAGEVCLRYLKTKTFDDVAHMKNHAFYDTHFGAMSISENLLEKSVIPEEMTIKKEMDIKTEPVSQDTNIEVKTEVMQFNQDNIKLEPSAPISTVKKRKIKLNL